jgi:hypothetical protein
LSSLEDRRRCSSDRFGAEKKPAYKNWTQNALKAQCFICEGGKVRCGSKSVLNSACRKRRQIETGCCQPCKLGVPQCDPDIHPISSQQGSRGFRQLQNRTTLLMGYLCRNETTPAWFNKLVRGKFMQQHSFNTDSVNLLGPCIVDQYSREDVNLTRGVGDAECSVPFLRPQAAAGSISDHSWSLCCRYVRELLEADRQLLAQGQRRKELQQCHREIQERRLTLQRRAGQV